jgi:hypothetical protein
MKIRYVVIETLHVMCVHAPDSQIREFCCNHSSVPTFLFCIFDSVNSYQVCDSDEQEN